MSSHDTPTDGAVAALADLAHGRIGGWAGLPASATRADCEAAFGDSGDDEDGVTRLGADWATFRRWPPLPVSPAGATAFFVNDELVLVVVQQPTLATDELASLGEPEAILDSKQFPFSDHLVWAGRGLALHRSRVDPSFGMLAAFRPLTLDAYLRSPMAGEGSRRHAR